jgi:hypothetical protein
MKRGKRLAFTVAATALVVVVVLGMVYRGALRDHLEAWHFQLTRKTEIVEPDPSQKEIPNRGTGFHMRGTGEKSAMHPQAADCSSLPYIRLLAGYSGVRVIFSDDGPKPLFRTVTMRRVPGDVGVEKIKKALEREGWRIIEQRFPRKAYVVIRDTERAIGQAPDRFGGEWQ